MTMKTIIIAYLFCKAMVNAEFSKFDSRVALIAWEETHDFPSFAVAIALSYVFGSVFPVRLPEARADILFSIKEWIGGLWHS